MKVSNQIHLEKKLCPFAQVVFRDLYLQIYHSNLDNSLVYLPVFILILDAKIPRVNKL